jgi:hypothetical protein
MRKRERNLTSINPITIGKKVIFLSLRNLLTSINPITIGKKVIFLSLRNLLTSINPITIGKKVNLDKNLKICHIGSIKWVGQLTFVSGLLSVVITVNQVVVRQTILNVFKSFNYQLQCGNNNDSHSFFIFFVNSILQKQWKMNQT